MTETQALLENLSPLSYVQYYPVFNIEGLELFMAVGQQPSLARETDPMQSDWDHATISSRNPMPIINMATLSNDADGSSL